MMGICDISSCSYHASDRHDLDPYRFISNPDHFRHSTVCGKRQRSRSTLRTSYGCKTARLPVDRITTAISTEAEEVDNGFQYRAYQELRQDINPFNVDIECNNPSKDSNNEQCSPNAHLCFGFLRLAQTCSTATCDEFWVHFEKHTNTKQVQVTPKSECVPQASISD